MDQLDGILIPILFLALVDFVIRGISLWKSARSGQKGWFFFLFILNTMGILPFIYLMFFQKKKDK